MSQKELTNNDKKAIITAYSASGIMNNQGYGAKIASNLMVNGGLNKNAINAAIKHMTKGDFRYMVEQLAKTNNYKLNKSITNKFIINRTPLLSTNSIGGRRTRRRRTRRHCTRRR